MPTYTQTTTYDQPVLAFSTISGITIPGSPNPILVPLNIQQYSEPQERANVSLISTMGIINPQTNFTYGGKTLAHGINELSKANVSGYIDTPMQAINSIPGVIYIKRGKAVLGTTSFVPSGSEIVTSEPLNVPNVTANGIRVTYAELIMMTIEGRAGTSWGTRVDPIYFRDPFGRQYTKVRILDFTAAYVEGVPGRTTFTLSLLVI